MSSVKYNTLISKFLKKTIIFSMIVNSVDITIFTMVQISFWRISANYHKINIIVYSSNCVR